MYKPPILHIKNITVRQMKKVIFIFIENIASSNIAAIRQQNGYQLSPCLHIKNITVRKRKKFFSFIENIACST